VQSKRVGRISHGSDDRRRMPPVRQALGIITFSAKGSGWVWSMCAFRTPGSTTPDRENRLIHTNEQMPCLYMITGAHYHPRRDPPSPIAHHPFLCYRTAISTRGEYSPELSISILSACSIIEAPIRLTQPTRPIHTAFPLVTSKAELRSFRLLYSAIPSSKAGASRTPNANPIQLNMQVKRIRPVVVLAISFYTVIRLRDHSLF